MQNIDNSRVPDRLGNDAFAHRQITEPAPPAAPEVAAMESGQLLLDAFDRRRDVFVACLKAGRREFSEAAVHDLRVAARRLLAFVEVARLLDPKPRPLKARGQLKDLIDGFDDLRNAQVMLAGMDEHARQEASLLPVREYLLARERTLLKDARRATRAFEGRQLQRRLERLRKRLARRLSSPDPSFDPFAAVDESFAVVTQRDGVARPEEPATIHQVRLAFKKFRYRLEIIHPALPTPPPGHLARLDAYQTLIGRIQDADTFLAVLADYAAHRPDYESTDSMAYYTNLRTQAIAAWLADRGALAAFWRPAPDQPFPWLERPPRHRADAI